MNKGQLRAWWLAKDIMMRRATPRRIAGRIRQILWASGIDLDLPAAKEADSALGRLLEELDPESPVKLRKAPDGS